MFATSRFRVPLAVVLAFGACALVATPASANFVVSADDPTGDAADVSPARDIVRVGLAYDRRTGTLQGGVRLAGSPTTETAANLNLFAANRTASGDCEGYPALGFSTQTDLRDALWVRFDAAGSKAVTGTAEKVYDEVAEEYEASTRSLAGRRPDCVFARLNDPANEDAVYDMAGPFKLRALPELSVTVGKARYLETGGSARTLRVVVRNVGDASSGRIRLKLKRQRGLSVRMPRTLKSLRAGQRRTVRVRLRARKGARSNTPLLFSATGTKGIRAQDDSYVLVVRGSKAGSGSGSGGGGKTKLCLKYTWLPPYSSLEICPG